MFICETEGDILSFFTYSTNGSIAPTTERLRFDKNDSLSEFFFFQVGANQHFGGIEEVLVYF